MHILWVPVTPITQLGVALEAMACDCKVIASNRVGALSREDAREACRRSRHWCQSMSGGGASGSKAMAENPDEQYSLTFCLPEVSPLRLQFRDIPNPSGGSYLYCPIDLRKKHNLALQKINKRFLERIELAGPRAAKSGKCRRILRIPIRKPTMNVVIILYYQSVQ